MKRKILLILITLFIFINNNFSMNSVNESASSKFIYSSDTVNISLPMLQSTSHTIVIPESNNIITDINIKLNIND